MRQAFIAARAKGLGEGGTDKESIQTGYLEVNPTELNEICLVPNKCIRLQSFMDVCLAGRRGQLPPHRILKVLGFFKVYTHTHTQLVNRRSRHSNLLDQSFSSKLYCRSVKWKELCSPTVRPDQKMISAPGHRSADQWLRNAALDHCSMRKEQIQADSSGLAALFCQHTAQLNAAFSELI